MTLLPGAQAQDALDAAASELEAAAQERSHLWHMLREAKPAVGPPPTMEAGHVATRRRSWGRRANGGGSGCSSAAWNDA